MKKVSVEVSSEFEFEYDPESPEFKEALETFKEQYDMLGNEEDLFAYVARHMVRLGREYMVECIGYVGLKNRKLSETESEAFSGITVSEEQPYIFADVRGLE